MDLLQQFSDKYMKEEAPSVRVGDTVRVHIRVKEGSRERIQVFEGTVIAKKHGGIEESFTVRRISYGVGVERCSPCMLPPSRRWRPSARARSAAPSCTICATAWARPLRSKRICKLRDKKGAGDRSFFIQRPVHSRRRWMV